MGLFKLKKGQHIFVEKESARVEMRDGCQVMLIANRSLWLVNSLLNLFIGAYEFDQSDQYQLK